MDPIKVYPGLKDLQPDQTYHLGYYDVDFQDGQLRFQLFAKICGEQDCHCDNLQIDWVAENTVFHTWYTGEREWRDIQHQPVHRELASVFRIVEDLEVFQGRYLHMMYLRRKQVLQALEKLSPSYQLMVPSTLISADGNPSQGLLGRVATSAKGSKGYGLMFCGDPNCFCRNIFLNCEGQSEPCFSIDLDSNWTLLEGAQSDGEKAQIKSALGKSPLFEQQLAFFRSERQLENYHRFVMRYPKEVPAP